VRFCRFAHPLRGPSLGAVGGGPDEVVADLGALQPECSDPVPWLRRLQREARAAADLGERIAAAPAIASLGELERGLALLPPVAAPEVWAAGVTYERSRDARDRETQVGAAGPTPYDRVYVAARPELFLKATGWRVVGPGRPVGLRSDSRWQVPEPELALVLDGDGAILGYTLGNDLSARDIEGENPLYLPQAKIFRSSCALGPTVRPAAPGAEAPFPLACTVRRGGVVAWAAETSTAQMRRSFAELTAHLLRDNWVLPGTVLLTGTGVVPPDDFSLQPGDEIEIASPTLGVLRNVAAPA